MTFVDTLAFVSGFLFYSGLVGYLTYLRFGPRRTFEHLKAQAVTLWLDRYVMTPLSPSVTLSESPGTSPTTIAQTTSEVKTLFAMFLVFLLFATGSAIAALITGGGALPQPLTTAL